MTEHNTKMDGLASFSRRKFIAAGTLLGAGLLFRPSLASANRQNLKLAVDFPHFPSRLHGFVWRNWFLVSTERIANVVGCAPDDIIQMGTRMGLPAPASITSDQERRSYLTIIRRNWHLLPREQILVLLDWDDSKLTFTLREDDFFFYKLGSLKPECAPIIYRKPNAQELAGEQRIARVIRKEFPGGFPRATQPLFHFVKELSAPMTKKPEARPSGFANRYGYAYFALFGDQLLEPDLDPYPDAYLDRMVDAGMAGIWLHIVLSKITPFPWEPSHSANWETRLENLSKLIVRAKQRGIGIYLYLNEPRYMPLKFYEKYPDLKGVTIDDQAALCTSHPDVQRYLVDSIALIAQRAPGLAGFFSITASENHTNCWSHGNGSSCPRCGSRGAAAVIAELNTLYAEGISKGSTREERPELIVWDWGWKDGLAEEIIPKLPKQVAFMSVSEWDIEINRGGVKTKVGEYSISVIGPGPRALRHWKLARAHGLKTIAKIQAGNTWEIAAVPYIPALENVATHAVNLRKEKVDGLMLGWTLGGYPSPNLEVVSVIGANPELSAVQAMSVVAKNRYGAAADAVVEAWRAYSAAFSEFPYKGNVVYNAPFQVGPANPLWEKPTGYTATMVGIPYDDLKNWTSIYPPDVFAAQLTKVTEGFLAALEKLQNKTAKLNLKAAQRAALNEEFDIAETIAIHYGSIVNQVRFISLRDAVAKLTSDERKQARASLEQTLEKEIVLAKRMNVLQNRNAKLGFEATNHYFYIPSDLVEKVINCRDLISRWLPVISQS
jgi:hypothetical protein